MTDTIPQNTKKRTRKLLEFNANKPLPLWVKEAIETNLLIEQEDAKSAGALGFMSRAMVLSSMPYKNPKEDVFYRKSGDFSLRIVAGYEGGIPYGIYPRLLLSWLVTEIVRTKNPNIELGDTLRDFLTNTMKLKSTGGGERGSRTAVLEQMKRLFGSLITAQFNGTSSGKGFVLRGVQIANELTLYENEYDGLFALQASDYGVSQSDLAKLEKTELAISEADDIESRLWTPQENNRSGWKSHVVVNHNFFQECLESPVPIDLRAYSFLRSAPMAMDIYAWLTYRMFSIKRSTRVIPWESLIFQFGNQIKVSKNDPTLHIRKFKSDFIDNLNRVMLVYPKAKIELKDNGIILHPSPTHVDKLIIQPNLF